METRHPTPKEVPDSTSDCKPTRLSISLRLDGELSELEQQKLARHLNHCKVCARFATSLANLTETLRSSAPRSPSTPSTLTAAPATHRLHGIARAARDPVRRLLLTVAAGVIVAVAYPVIAVADEFPTLAPGGSAVVAGTQVSCNVTATSVSCKAAGLTATLVKSGIVHVAKGSRTLFSTTRPRQLHANNGFVLISQDIYCHVYVVGASILTCSLVYSPGGAPKTHGFDISDHAVVVFAYDTAGNRHDVKTFP